MGKVTFSRFGVIRRRQMTLSRLSWFGGSVIQKFKAKKALRVNKSAVLKAA